MEINKKTVQVKRWAFYFDQSRCLACNACTVACKDWYGVNPGEVSYRHQMTYEMETDGIPSFYSLVMSCNHCENPACVSACAAGAITKRSDGIVIVDRSKCQELKSCLSACPFGAPGIADDRQEPVKGNEKWSYNHPMQKCNMCYDLLDKGEKTICERSCVGHAIEVGDYDELMAKHAGAVQVNISQFPYAYKNGTDTSTGPSFLIKPRKALSVDKAYGEE